MGCGSAKGEKTPNQQKGVFLSYLVTILKKLRPWLGLLVDTVGM